MTRSSTDGLRGAHADRTYVCEHCGLTVDRDRNAAINLARLGETQCTGATGTGTGRSPAATDSGGDGRGATQKTRSAAAEKAAGCEASTRHDNTVGQAGTVASEGEAA
ncbi:zinc ribbon domain-containing protein [Rhodococcus sp. SMB37]|uniref:zinc ribbon domain-containing protein n=1 Tax=Rhodococcus sp. SMB37 TaxID=2512213 RepID=UPI0006D2513F|nr:zinc ribbon domain-containing protein [Rhodococcus sp. SMB37]